MTTPTKAELIEHLNNLMNKAKKTNLNLSERLKKCIPLKRVGGSVVSPLLGD